jgi:mono/diheme cytochrome c family protein
MRWWPTFLALWISAGLWGCSGPDEELPEPYRGLAVPEARLASAGARAGGRELYLRYCALCHGERADGHGMRRPPGARPADFTNPVWRRAATPREVFFIIREGKRGTSMPAWYLSDEETWDLVAYLLSVADEGP